MTDYTQKQTFQHGYDQQYRLMMYLRDLIRNWFADSRNIKDQRLISMLYDSDGQFKPQIVKIGTPFTYDHKYAGATPCINILIGDISYSHKPVNRGNNPAFSTNPMQPIVASYVLKTIQSSVSVTTESYDGTILLAQYLQLFLQMNSNNIQKDCKLLDSFFVSGISSVQPIQATQTGNAKQLYTCQINLSTSGHVTWTQNTQGPVYNGLTIKTNFNN